MSEKRKPTQQDVAREAGVSQSAVSCVILRTRPISKEVADRVYAAIDRLGYTPYRVRRLKSPRQIVLIVVDNATSENITYFQKIVESRGYAFRLVVMPNRKRLNVGEAETLANLNENPAVAGIISAHPYLDAMDLLARCKNKESVIFFRENSILSHSYVPHERIAAMAVQLCRRLKYPQVGAFFYDLQAITRFDREGCESFMNFPFWRRSGVTLHSVQMDPDADNTKLIEEQMERWLDAGVRLIFSWYSEIFYPLQQWAYRKKLRIPEDFSLFCYDPSHLCRTMSPPVSVIEPPDEQLARFCMEEMFARIRHEEVPERTLSPRWIDRGSVIVNPAVIS